MGLEGPPLMLYCAEATPLTTLPGSVTVAVSVAPVLRATGSGFARTLETTGTVSSIFTVTSVAALVLPATLVQRPLSSVPAVSALTLMGAVQLATPLGPTSPVAIKLTVVLLLFQPAPLAGGVRAA